MKRRLQIWFYTALARLYGIPRIQNIPKGFDPLLGQCRFDGMSAYDCLRRIQTVHSATTEIGARIWLYGDQPSDPQRIAFSRIIDTYDEMWPRVAAELICLHPDLETVEEIELHVRDRVSVTIGEHSEDSVELIYQFDLPDDDSRGFFLRIENHEIIEAVIAE